MRENYFQKFACYFHYYNIAIELEMINVIDICLKFI